MVLTYVADTSVVTRLSVDAVADRSRPLLLERSVACTRVTALEVGSSARSAGEFDALASALGVFEPVDLDEADARRAIAVQRMLAAADQRGRKIPDLLIAAAAERLGLCVLHYDRDVERIASVTGQRQEWVVRAGSVG